MQAPLNSVGIFLASKQKYDQVANVPLKFISANTTEAEFATRIWRVARTSFIISPNWILLGTPLFFFFDESSSTFYPLKHQSCAQVTKLKSHVTNSMTRLTRYNTHPSQLHKISSPSNCETDSAILTCVGTDRLTCLHCSQHKFGDCYCATFGKGGLSTFKQ